MGSRHAGRPSDAHSARPTSPRHARRRRRGGGVAALTALGLLLFGGTGVALAYGDIQGNIQREDITALLGREPEEEPRPVDPSAGRPLNFLVLGTDAREGESDIDGAGAAGEVVGMRADTTMLIHVSADRSRVEVVSIPRDTLVDIPSCTLPDGTVTEAHRGMFNSAFSIGGDTGNVGSAAACTIRTVEKLTGLRVDDFVVVDFAGFIGVIDALDGIAVYVPDPVDDPLYTGLDVAQGCHVFDGEDALAYSRVRHGVGDGGDISRISRQQSVVGAVVDEALSKNLLTDLPSLYAFLDASTKTLTTGSDLGSLTTIGGLANSLRNIDPAAIDFITMPHEPAGPRVVPVPETRELWLRLQADDPERTEPASPDATGSADGADGAGDTQAEGDGGTGADAPEDAGAVPAEGDEGSAGEAGAAGAAAEPSPTPTPVCTK